MTASMSLKGNAKRRYDETGQPGRDGDADVEQFGVSGADGDHAGEPLRNDELELVPGDDGSDESERGDDVGEL